MATTLEPFHRRSFFTDDEELFRKTARAFLDREVDGNLAKYVSGEMPVRELWTRAADAGVIAMGVPEEYGGMGGSEVYNIILSYELGRTAGCATVGGVFTTDNVTHALFLGASEELKRRLAPKLLRGAIQCMGMTEPDAGTNLAGIRTRARRDGDAWVLNGSKIFISMGDIADIVYVIAKTEGHQDRDVSVFLVETPTPGLTQRRIDMMGLPLTGLGELFLQDVRVPAGNLIGGEGKAIALLSKLMAADRVHSSTRALAQAELALDLTIEYTKQRTVAGGKQLFEFQNTQMRLAEMAIEVSVGQELFRGAVEKIRNQTLTPTDADIVKVYFTDMSARVIDCCVQLFGAAGLAEETVISKMYAQNRQFRIFAGTTELLKLSIARRL